MFNTSEVKGIIQEAVVLKSKMFQNERLLSSLQDVAALLVDRFKNGNHLYFCGNGGSAADAQHLAAEFSGKFYMDRDPLPAEALHCNTSYLTAVANDFGYDTIYSRLIKGIGKPGDILIGLSTSGNSANIVNAFHSAKMMGMITIAMTGEDGGALKSLADYFIPIPSSNTPRIQEGQMLLGHIICQLVEAEIFKTK